MRTQIIPVAVLSGLMLVTAACSDTFDVPDLNNPGLESLENNPTLSAILDATQGLMIGSRAGISGQTGYVAHLGMMGRESLTFDNSDPRYFDEILAGDLIAGNGAFGGSGWTARYRNIRNANIVLNALEGEIVGLTTADSEGIRGFAKTLQAIDYLIVVNMRDVNGLVIETNRTLDDELAPFSSKDAGFAHVVTLLNEAQGHLASAGSAFRFQLSGGFSGFDDPSSFILFNRALLARVEVYRGNYGAALAALGQSFVDVGGGSAGANLGVFYSFGTGSGDATNGLFQGSDPQIVVHPSVLADADPSDERVQAKTSMLATQKFDVRGVTADFRWEHYPTLSSPLAIIRNEELILLQAEAEWFTGDQAGAMSDLNYVRVNSGGLGALGPAANDTEFIDMLLNERRWSLLMEGGHRWIDSRRFGRLGDLALDRPTDLIPSAFPIPRNECLARGINGLCSF